jgi:hypothetical protein
MLPDGTVLLAGGEVHGQGTLASAQLYDPGLPVPLPPAGVIAPGTYFLSNPDTLCLGGCASYKRIIFALPAGWATSHGLVYKHLGQSGEVAFSAWTVDQIYDDPCHWQRSTLSPLDIAHTSFDSATGGRIIPHYVGGLANQAFRGPSPRPLTQMMVAGWDGSGYAHTLALRIDLSVPANLDISKCDKGQFRSWTEWHVPGGADAHYARGQLDAVYMIDVDRRTLVIDASHMPGTSAADLAELNTIIAGMIFDRS